MFIHIYFLILDRQIHYIIAIRFILLDYITVVLFLYLLYSLKKICSVGSFNH